MHFLSFFKSKIMGDGPAKVSPHRFTSTKPVKTKTDVGGNNRKIQQQKGDLVWLSAEYISRAGHRPRFGAPPGPAIKHTPNNAGWSHLPCFPPPTEHTRLRVDSQRTDTPSITMINNKKDAQASAGCSSFLRGTSFPQIPACSYLHRGENTELAAAL